MFLPIRSDRPLRTTPYINYALIAINIVIFGLTYQAMNNDSNHWTNRLMLWSYAYGQAESGVLITRLFQFISYQFLHGSPMHLIGNMIFLYVFGNAVEDRLGKVGYLFFYLGAGVLAGLAHWLTSPAPVLGASGSVAGVTGAYLAFFPRTRITIIYFFFLIGAFQLSAIWLVMIYVALDLYFFAVGVGNTAYTAHLMGYIAGFGVAMALLGTRVLPREVYDLFTLYQHKRRRDHFRKLAQDGYTPWDAGRIKQGKHAGPVEPTEEEKRLLAKRAEISRAMTAHDMPAAAEHYAQLIAEHGQQPLSQRQQFEMANHLAGQGQHEQAAQAYEMLLRAYPKHADKGHAQLMLGLINARYLGKPSDAKPLLQEASQRLQGDDAALARQLLREIG